MIALTLPALSDAETPFVVRLGIGAEILGGSDAVLLEEDEAGATYACRSGLIVIDGVRAADLAGDVVLVQPGGRRVERLLRAGSAHNTLLVTERCDQLCVMCSQPPKKTHVDRFDLLTQACLLAQPAACIGISGGEPTLFKTQLFELLERVLDARTDLSFHVLTNGQHFDEDDVDRLRAPAYRRVSWGVPIYAADPNLHDEIVAKPGAFARLEETMAHLLLGRARVELRTVVLRPNAASLPRLARYVSTRLRFVESWSIMQLEHIGFAKGRWDELYFDHLTEFEPIATSLDHSLLYGVNARLFNFPSCTVPSAYRTLAVASISDWKRKFAEVCSNCRSREDCSGFFEWHPEEHVRQTVRPL